jgi:hypothetical protein
MQINQTKIIRFLRESISILQLYVVWQLALQVQINNQTGDLGR